MRNTNMIIDENGAIMLISIKFEFERYYYILDFRLGFFFSHLLLII